MKIPQKGCLQEIIMRIADAIGLEYVFKKVGFTGRK